MNKHLTDEVITAFKSADFLALHRALNLTPWNASPLPVEIESLGVDQGDPPDYMDAAQRRDWRNAQALQRELLQVTGWPDCRAAYEANLKEAKEWCEYCRELVLNPKINHSGTNSDPTSRRRKLEEAEARVAYRKKLLADLDVKVPA